MSLHRVALRNFMVSYYGQVSGLMRLKMHRLPTFAVTVWNNQTDTFNSITVAGAVLELSSAIILPDSLTSLLS